MRQTSRSCLSVQRTAARQRWQTLSPRQSRCRRPGSRIFWVWRVSLSRGFIWRGFEVCGLGFDWRKARGVACDRSMSTRGILDLGFRGCVVAHFLSEMFPSLLHSIQHYMVTLHGHTTWSIPDKHFPSSLPSPSLPTTSDSKHTSR